METNVQIMGTAKVLGKRPAKDAYPARVQLGYVGGQIDPAVTAEVFDRIPEGGYIRFAADFSIHPKFGFTLGKLTQCEVAGDPGATTTRAR